MIKKKKQTELDVNALAKLWGINAKTIKINGDNLTVGGSLYLRGCTGLTSLPDNLTVGDYLYLQGCTGLTSLPDNLTVGDYLDLRGCTGLTSLPDNLTVGGSLYLQDTKITETKRIKRPSDRLSIDLKLSIECKFNIRGFTIADGILAKILHSKGRVKKIIIWGEKEASYLVSDKNGNYAHGETIAKAREDLIYKAVAKFDGEIPNQATGKEWIGIYRAITGACEAGVKNFVEKTGKSLDKTYTAKQIANLVQGNFGADKFAEKVSGDL